MKRIHRMAALLLAAAVLLAALTSCSLTDKIADGILDKIHGLAGGDSPESPIDDPDPITDPGTDVPQPNDPGNPPAEQPEEPEQPEITYTWKLTVENDTDREITNLFAEPPYRDSADAVWSEPAPRLSAPLAAGESVTLDLTDCADVEAGSPFELTIQIGDLLCSINSYALTPGDTLYLYRRSDAICAQAEKPSVDYTPVLDDIDWHPISADYVSLMTPAMKDDWNKIVDTVIAHGPSVQLSGTLEDFVFLHNCLYNWRLSFLVDVSELDASSGTLNFTYTYASGEQEQILNDLKYELLTSLNAIITRDMNTTEKVMAVYSWCSNRMEYDYGYVEDMNASYDPFFYPDLDIWRGLSTGLGVCHTYSYLAEFMLCQLGIECLTLKSDMYDGTRHAWLCVKLDDGKFYHFDPTWEHTDGSFGLTYFGMSDNERAADGVVDYSYSYCNGYGPVACDSEFFYNLRDVWAWGFGPGHTVLLYCDDINETVIYNTVTGSRSLPMQADYVIQPYEIPEDYWGYGEESEDGWESLTPEYEAEQKKLLTGEWVMYSADAHADAAWLTLNGDGTYTLKIDQSAGLWAWNTELQDWSWNLPDQQTVFTYSGSWELSAVPRGPVLRLHLQDTNDESMLGWAGIGDFLYEEVTNCDGQKIVNFIQYNNGDSAFSIHFPYPMTWEWMLERTTNEPLTQGVRKNDTFAARLWKSKYGGGEDGSNDFIIWADDVEQLDYCSFVNLFDESVPYVVSPNGNGENLSVLSGGPDGLFAYGEDNNYYQLTTDASGAIIDCVYLPSNEVPDSERTFLILEGYDEYRLALESGMTAVPGEVSAVYGRNVQLVSVGTDHGDVFVSEMLYAVAEFDEVYRYDAVSDTWIWLDQNAMG